MSTRRPEQTIQRAVFDIASSPLGCALDLSAEGGA
jgi:hypothetical protein